jgi:hypothetical protein
MPSPLPYTKKKEDISWIDVVASACHTIYANREQGKVFNKIFRVSDC